MIEMKCQVCGITFTKIPSYFKRTKKHYCSAKCRSTGSRAKVEVECDNCHNTFMKAPSVIERSKHHYCNKECRANYIQGINNPFWKGGKVTEQAKIRGSLEYKAWRLDVFERDAFTCQICGDDQGCYLNAHHLRSFARFPELRLDINNGVTLCTECHQGFHNLYGRLNFTSDDFHEWIREINNGR